MFELKVVSRMAQVVSGMAQVVSRMAQVVSGMAQVVFGMAQVVSAVVLALRYFGVFCVENNTTFYNGKEVRQIVSQEVRSWRHVLSQ